MWVEFVVGSRLVLRVFLRVLGFSLLHKDQHLQIPISPGLWTCIETSKADVASSLKIVNFFINFLEITEKHLQVETLRKRESNPWPSRIPVGRSTSYGRLVLSEVIY